MFNIPSRRQHLDSLPKKGYSYVVDEKIPNYHDGSIITNQGGQGVADVFKKVFGGISPMKIADRAISGRVPTKLKTMINMRSGIKNARPAFKGEKHPLSRVNNRIAFNNYLGPNTSVSERLLRGDKPISKSDKAGYAHDLRFATVSRDPKKGVPYLRDADRKFISKLKQLESQGEPKLNTRVGIRGIQLKNRLEDKGIISRTKFLNPMTDNDPAKPIAIRELSRLEQEGYGQVLPGEKLKKKVMRQLKKDKLTRHGREMPNEKGKQLGGKRFNFKDLKNKMKRPTRPKQSGPPRIGQLTLPFKSISAPMLIARLMTKQIVPTLIGQIAKKTGIKPKMIGSGYKAKMMKLVERDMRSALQKRTKMNSDVMAMKGGAVGIGTLITLASLAGSVGIPIVTSIGKKIVPKLIGLFKKLKAKRNAKKGSGINISGGAFMDGLKEAFGKAIWPIFKMFSKMVIADYKRTKGGSLKLSGMGIGVVGGSLKKLVKFIKRSSKNFVGLASRGIKGVKKGIKTTKRIVKGVKKGVKITKGIIKDVKGIKSVKDVGKIILNKALPSLISMIRKKTGIEPTMMGSGMKRDLLREITIELRKKQGGGSIGSLLALGAKGAVKLAPIVLPLVMKLGEKILPKLLQLFKRRKTKGGSLFTKLPSGEIIGPLRKLLGNIILKVMGKMFNNLKKGAQAGQGIQDFVKKISSKFVDAFKMVMSPEFRKGFKKGFTGVFKETGKIAGPIIKEAGPILIKQGLPLLLKALVKK